MTVTTFEMQSHSSAPTRTGAVLIPFADRWESQWEDVDSSRTRLHVRHPAEDTEELVARVLRAHPRVHVIS